MHRMFIPKKYNQEIGYPKLKKVFLNALKSSLPMTLHKEKDERYYSRIFSCAQVNKNLKNDHL